MVAFGLLKAKEALAVSRSASEFLYVLCFAVELGNLIFTFKRKVNCNIKFRFN